MEEIYAKDKYLQEKLKELAQLKSELMLMQNPGIINFDNVFVQNEKDEQELEVNKKDALQKKIGKDLVDVIRKVFIKYSGINDYFNVKKLEYSAFHKFLEDAGLYTANLTRVQVDLMLYKNRNSNSLDFWRFVETLIKISRHYYVSQKKYQSFITLVNKKVLPGLKFVEETEVFTRYHCLYRETSVQTFFTSRKPTFKAIFQLFKSTDSSEMECVPTSLRSKRNKKNQIERILRITLKGFLSFLTAFEFLPDLISGLASAKLFRSVPCPLLFNECLTFSEFQEACFYTALHIYESQPYKELCSSPMECLEIWMQFLDAHPQALIKNPNPLRNSVYTLQQDIDYSKPN